MASRQRDWRCPQCLQRPQLERAGLVGADHPTALLREGSRLLTDFSESSGVQMWGRLQPGLAPAAAEEELASLAAELRRQHPDGIWEKESLPSEPGGLPRA